MADSGEKELNQNEHNKEEQEENQFDECSALKENFVRLTADFQNFKKRVEKDKEQWFYNAQADIVMAFLPIVDDFERALTEAKKNGQEANFAQWLAGFELMYKSLQTTLEKMGVKPIEEVVHFNPELHEALVSVQSDEHKSGDIVQVLQQGFMFKGRVLRPSKVSVAG